jgi:hypothetical protein
MKYDAVPLIFSETMELPIITVMFAYTAVVLIFVLCLFRTRGLRFISIGAKSRSWLSKCQVLVCAFIAAWAWTLLHALSAAFLVWVAKKLKTWCKKTVFSFSGDAVQNYVAFTIDDAPGRGEPFLNEVLELLKLYNSKCTFFLISSQINSGVKEDFLRRCILEGDKKLFTGCCTSRFVVALNLL